MIKCVREEEAYWLKIYKELWEQITENIGNFVITEDYVGTVFESDSEEPVKHGVGLWVTENS